MIGADLRRRLLHRPGRTADARRVSPLSPRRPGTPAGGRGSTGAAATVRSLELRGRVRLGNGHQPRPAGGRGAGAGELDPGDLQPHLVRHPRRSGSRERTSSPGCRSSPARARVFDNHIGRAELSWQPHPRLSASHDRPVRLPRGRSGADLARDDEEPERRPPRDLPGEPLDRAVRGLQQQPERPSADADRRTTPSWCEPAAWARTAGSSS